MRADQDRIHAIPTNIITGFLGVGKTSAILHLLKSKPKSERWAVLVNEFGEIGVDGHLFEGQYSIEEGVFIREVPGGCMCCAAGLPMQVALNQLLIKAKPDRLLIEPTGLGHPKEVLRLLSSEYYQQILSLEKTLVLVDARNISDQRYTNHETFTQQIMIADRVIGNKSDLYQDEDKTRLIAYLKNQGKNYTDLRFTQYGEIEISLLQGPTASPLLAPHKHHAHTTKPLVSETPIPECGYIKAMNQGEGFYSVGWRFSPEKVFNRQKLLSFFTGLKVDRMKAVVITDEGVFGYNLTEDTLKEIELDDCMDSRIEMISDHFIDTSEAQLLDSVIA